ncbi:hypothetical protein JCM3775_005205 [Rhodotorula graminis]
MHTVSLPPAGAPAPDEATAKALDTLTLAVARSKRAVLLVGAGISTSAGIPDFRSQGTGLYSTPSPPSTSTSTSRTPPPVTPPATLKGPALFSAAVYSSPDTTAEHLRFIAAFKRSLDSVTLDPSSSSSTTAARPGPATPTHDFMRLLKKRNKLLRVYTQNIDGLEAVGTGLVPVALEGITPRAAAPSSSSAAAGKGKGKAKVEGDYVQLHGAVHAVRCTGCDFVRAWTDEDGDVFASGSVGVCPQCEERASVRLARGQRTLSSLSRAFLRPSITLYNEAPPSSAALTIGALSLSDLSGSPGPDVMLVLGTSLKIPGFKKLVKEFARSVKSRGGVRVLVNREEVGSKSEWRDVFDYQVLGDTDAFVTRLVGDWKRLRPQDWSGKQATLGELFASSKGAAVGPSSKKAPPSSPRKPLAPLSINGTPPSPVRTTKKRLASSPEPEPASPSPSKRARHHLATPTCPSSSPSPSSTSVTPGSTPRTTRNSLVLRGVELPPLPALATPPSPRRPAAAAAAVGALGPPRHATFARSSGSPTKTGASRKAIASAFKPPRRSASPSPCPCSSSSVRPGFEVELRRSSRTVGAAGRGR